MSWGIQPFTLPRHKAADEGASEGGGLLRVLTWNGGYLHGDQV